MRLNKAARETSFLGEQGPHVFVSPHADDVVLSCGGTIHSLLSESKPVEVIGVFAGTPETPRYSAYARHLHAKWQLAGNPIEERWREDSAAMRDLGIASFERWDYLEAPYRTAGDGRPLYGGNEELTGPVEAEDEKLRDDIAQKVRIHLEKLPDTAVLYFPLALGHHVDHQILYEIGLALCASGKQIRFYEDFPYAENYKANGFDGGWQPTIISVSVEMKLRAANAYASQVRGLGGSISTLEKRLRDFGASVGNGDPSERYWKITIPGAKELVDPKVGPGHPLVRKDPEIRFRDFGKFLKTFRWHDLDEILSLGDGYCLDVGCGNGRQRNLIQARGYQWVGLDRSGSEPDMVAGNANALPLRDRSVAAVVAWQIMEYLEQPEAICAEAARVLEPCGVFCGSVSFLEPVHGQTYFNMSPLILEKLLTQHGFADIEIKPGLNGFALMLWTWLRRSAIPFADRLAIPLALALFGPVAALMFCSSWLAQRLGFGSGHTMEWLSRKAPLEFAGHVMFSARKRART